MNARKAAIIAGGQGTRLRSFTGDLIPKAMASVSGIPIIFRQISLLARYNIKKVAVMAGHLSEKLSESLPAEADKYGISIEFFIEQEPLGTAGGFHAAREFLADGDFLVLYGDIVVEMNLDALFSYHKEKEATGTIVAHPNDHPHESDLLKINEENRILEILKKEKRKPGFYRNMVPAAIYCFNPDVFNYIEPLKKQEFINDVFPGMIRSGVSLFAYNTTEYLRDMGTPQRFEMAERDIENGLMAKMNKQFKRPAVFFDRDGVLNHEVLETGVTSQNDLSLIPVAPRAVKAVNEHSWLTIVVTNQPQLAKGYTSFEELDKIHAKLETLLGYEGAKLDRIYFCPHHPETGFEGEIGKLKIDCECRKPRAGMIRKATVELPVDLEKSIMIGDTWRDVGAAREVGIPVLGVRTGFGCKGCSGKSRPDIIFRDVLEAVRFAVDGIPNARTLVAKLDRIASEKDDTVLVGICGIPRSGKSILSVFLKRELEIIDLQTLHIHLDDWILPRSQRRINSIVEERTQVQLYPRIIENLLSGESVSAPGYDPASRELIDPFEYRINQEKIVILDGILSCHEIIRDKLDFTIYVDCPEKIIKERCREFYRWKGEENHSIERLIKERSKEEWPTVRAQCKFTDEVFTYDQYSDTV